MPLIQKKPAPDSPHHKLLVVKLSDELTNTTPKGPTVIEEELRNGSIYITVIWDEWNDLQTDERGRIIMDAYALRRREVLPKISMALGLTSQEASKLGIEL
jgi:hypothetical protein